MKSLRAILARYVRRIVRRKKIGNYETYRNALEGKMGLEIGGPSAFFSTGYPLPIYPIFASLDGCNYSTTTFWEGKIHSTSYRCEGSHGRGRQHIADATNLSFSEDERYDFVISCHSLEHIANPIKAFKEWLRVIKSEGIVLVVVPHRDGHFDTGRPVSSLEHMLVDYSNEVQEDDLRHLQEIVDSHDFVRDKKFAFKEDLIKLLKKNREHRMMHHHVFSPPSIIRFIDHFSLQIMSVDLVKPYNIVCIAKKLIGGVHSDNARFYFPDFNDSKDNQYIFI